VSFRTAARLATLVVLCASAPSWAQTDTLSKIKKTQKLVIGTRESSPPLAITLGNGKYVGYHIDICKAIAADIKKELKLDTLATEYMAVTSQNRLSLVRNGTIDLECGSTTNNMGRQTQVAFAPTTFITHARLLVKADSPIRTIKDLSGKTVATTIGTTSVLLLRKHERATAIEFKQIFGKDHAESLLLVATDRADAFVMDDNILIGLMANSPNGTYKVVGEELSEEPIAIMLRKDDAPFKKLVDRTVRRLMQNGDINTLYEKWFKAPMSEALQSAIEQPNDRPAESYKK
jgi:glutamate/aspartate transport system substrate-binding protein